MQTLRALRPASALFVLGLFAPPADAWDRDTHVAIVNAALRLSPVAAARIPAGQQSTTSEAAGDADLRDRECVYHAIGAGPKAPQAEAERALERHRKGGIGFERPYLRAQSIGRYLHWVADSAMPVDHISRARPYPASELFANRNIVVFHDGRALTQPLAPSLLERGGEARWGDPGDGSVATAFRVAVNLTVEALLLLPAEPGAAVPDPDGPALFLVNAIDNGLGSTKIGEKYVGSTTEQLKNGATVTWDWYEEYRQQDAIGDRGAFLVSEKKGLTILEWNPKTSGATATFRALLYNNEDTCATKISLSKGSWQKSLPFRIGPRGVRVAEFEGPSDLSPEAMYRTWTPQPCTGVVEAGLSFPTGRRLIVGMSGQPPNFAGRETRVGSARVEPAVPEKPSLTGFAGETTLRNAEALVKHNQTYFGKLKIGDREVVLDEAAPYFGKDSVAQHLKLKTFVANTAGCPGTRARVYGSVKNVSRLKLRDLRALLVMSSPQSGDHNGQIQTMDPSDLMPGEEAEIYLWLSCDWARRAANGVRDQDVVVVLGDVAGRTEGFARPDGANPFVTPPSKPR